MNLRVGSLPFIHKKTSYEVILYKQTLYINVCYLRPFICIYVYVYTCVCELNIGRIHVYTYIYVCINVSYLWPFIYSETREGYINVY